MPMILFAPQVVIGFGVATEYPVERFLRDSQIIKTYEGTNGIQRLTIAKQLIRELKGIVDRLAPERLVSFMS